MDRLVLDVSYYQPNIDYEQVTRSQVEGVILRCGRTFWGSLVCREDESFQTHYEGFRRQGMPIGVYYYSAAPNVQVARQEADCVIEILKGKKFAYPIYYDVENEERQGSLTREELTDIVLTWTNRIREAGYYPGVYTSYYWGQNKLDLSRISDTLWIAQYASALTFPKKVGMWQFTDQGTVPGISSPVDLSHCYVDFPTLISRAGLNGFQKSGWQKDQNGWWYRNPDGSYPRNQWMKIDGLWYHFDAQGYLQYGWLQDGGKWYFLDPSGAMVTGWYRVNGKWYLFDSSGAMQIGVAVVGGKAYYLSSSGALVENADVTVRAGSDGSLRAK